MVLIMNASDYAPTQQRYRVQQTSTVDGNVLDISQDGDTSIVLLKQFNGATQSCETTDTVAQSLAKTLGQPVRLTGLGDWLRTQDGLWLLVKFRINECVVLNEISLNELFRTAREAKGNGWNDLADPIQEHLNIRGAI